MKKVIRTLVGVIIVAAFFGTAYWIGMHAMPDYDYPATRKDCVIVGRLFFGVVGLLPILLLAYFVLNICYLIGKAALESIKR